MKTKLIRRYFGIGDDCENVLNYDRIPKYVKFVKFETKRRLRVNEGLDSW